MKIPLTLDKIRTDPAAYKPYAPEFDGSNITVEFEIPDKQVKIKGDAYVVTPKGFEMLLVQIAKHVNLAHTAYTELNYKT